MAPWTRANPWITLRKSLFLTILDPWGEGIIEGFHYMKIQMEINLLWNILCVYVAIKNDLTEVWDWFIFHQ